MQDIIFDTDVGSDCDDMMALALLAYGTRQMGTHISAITHSNSAPGGIGCIKAALKSLGMSVPPIGSCTEGVPAYDKYSSAIAERYGEDDSASDTAVRTMRRALASGYEMTLLAVGPLTNVAALLDSEGDDISPERGIELMRERCKCVVVMGGKFNAPVAEWNIKLDVPAARALVQRCPTPIIFLPHESGDGVISGGYLLDAPDSPVSLSFKLFPGCDRLGGRHSWDPLATAYAIGYKNIFDITNGKVEIDECGVTTLTVGRGCHTVLTLRREGGESECEMKARYGRFIDERTAPLFD